MRNRVAPLGGLIGGVMLALVLAASVAAYAGQVAATVQVSGPSGPQACGTPITVTALVQETGGALVTGDPVAWSFVSGNVTGDRILSTPTNTNASGIASTTVQFACSPHSVVLGAMMGAASGTVAIAVSGKGLPRTDTLGGGTTSSLTMVLAGIAVLLGSAMILRRFAAARR
jgi:hypothetical protein